MVALPLAIPAAEAIWAAIVWTGSAIAAGVGISMAIDAVEEEFPPEPISTTQTCPSATGPCELPESDCPARVAQIRNITASIRNRYAEMLIDVHGLYPIRPLAKPPYGSWPGHIDKYNGERKGLRNMVDKAAAKGCVVPQEALDWIGRQPPSQPMSKG